MVKNLSPKAGDAGLIPGLGRAPEKEMATHSSILAWRIRWTEESDGSHGQRATFHGVAKESDMT